MAFKKNDYKRQLKQDEKKYQNLLKEQRRLERRKTKRKKHKETKEKIFEINARKEEIKNRLENLKEKGIVSAKKANKEIKKKKKSLFARIGGKIVIPIILFCILLTMALFLVLVYTMGSAVSTISGLANPQQRAILEAKGLIGDEDVSTIPKDMIGSEPDLQGSNGTLKSNKNPSSSNNGDLGDLTIKDSDPIDLVAYKAALQVQQKDHIQGKFALAQMYFETGSQLNSYLARKGKNLAGLSWPGRKPVPSGTTKGSTHAEGDGAYLYFDSYQHFADEYVVWLGQDIPNGESIKTAEQFATALKSKGYFTAPLSQYVNGVCKIADQKWSEMQQKYGNLNGKSNNSNSSDGDYSLAKMPAEAQWIAMKESSSTPGHVNLKAKNPSSDAVGIFQLMPYNFPKYKNYLNSESEQCHAAEDYMKQRYHTWQQAKAFWLANGWW